MKNTMNEIRVHGRGGQGVVTAAALLARAIYEKGIYVQAFPNFGVERRGAPVAAFVRSSDKEIKLRSQIYAPDTLIILDPSLIMDIDVFFGHKKGALVLINSEEEVRNIKKLPKDIKAYCIPAMKIALENLGMPITNMVMLGAFAAVSDLTDLNSVKKVIKEHFKGELAEKNIKAMRQAYNLLSNI